MSRGPGRLQRRLLELLEAAPERSLNRVELEQVLVEGEGFDPSNVRRSIKGLARKHLVAFTDQRHKKQSVVTLPRKVRLITDDELFALLTKAREAKAGMKR